MDDEKYNGWTNWDTWNTNLWLTNEEWAYKIAMACQNAECLKDFWNRFFRNRDGIKSNKVNFDEIYEMLHE